MASLLDIAPTVKTVAVQGINVIVYGVSARGIATLISRFPQVKDLMTGKQPEELTGDALMKLVPDAIAAVIAAGTGLPGDPAAEAVAEKLSAFDQLALLNEIIKLTMPEGVGPFVARLNEITALVDMGRDSK